MEETVKNEVVAVETNTIAISESATLMDELSKNSKELYCSIKADTIESRKLIFNALGQCDTRISDNLNVPIALKDVIIQRYTKVNDATGEVEEKTRTILIDANGKTYASASKGLFNSCKKLFALMGLPDGWEQPINIEVTETKTKNGFKTYEIKLV